MYNLYNTVTNELLGFQIPSLDVPEAQSWLKENCIWLDCDGVQYAEFKALQDEQEQMNIDAEKYTRQQQILNGEIEASNSVLLEFIKQQNDAINYLVLQSIG